MMTLKPPCSHGWFEMAESKRRRARESAAA